MATYMKDSGTQRQKNLKAKAYISELKTTNYMKAILDWGNQMVMEEQLRRMAMSMWGYGKIT